MKLQRESQHRTRLSERKEVRLRPRLLHAAAGQGQSSVSTKKWDYNYGRVVLKQQLDKDRVLRRQGSTVTAFSRRTRTQGATSARTHDYGHDAFKKAAEQGQGSASTRKFELLQAVTGLQGKGRSDNGPTSSSSRDKADAHMYDSIGVSCGSSLLDVSVRVCIYAVTVHMAHLFEWAWRFCSHVGNSLVVSLSQPLEEYALGLRMFICNALLSVRLHIQLCGIFLTWFCQKGETTFP